MSPGVMPIHGSSSRLSCRSLPAPSPSLAPAPLFSGCGDRRASPVSNRQVQRVRARRARHRRVRRRRRLRPREGRGEREQPVSHGFQRHARADVREGRERAGALHARDVRSGGAARVGADGEREWRGRGRRGGEEAGRVVACRGRCAAVVVNASCTTWKRLFCEGGLLFCAFWLVAAVIPEHE